MIPSPVTYTLKGFCLFIGLTEQGLQATYAKDPKFESVITRMREECEQSARRSFEQGTIPSQLAGLWMSNYGYGKERQDEEWEDDGFLEALRQEAKSVWEDD